MDRSIIVLMKSIKDCILRAKVFIFKKESCHVQVTGFLLLTFPRTLETRLNILRKITKRQLKLDIKCSAKLFFAFHLKLTGRDF